MIIDAHFITSFVGFIFINLIVLGSAILFAIVFNNEVIIHWKKFILTVAVFFFAQIFVVEILLGIFKLLNFQNALILSVIYLFLLLIFFGKRIMRQTRFSKLTFNNSFYFFAILSPFIAVFFLRYFNALFQIPLEYDNVAYHLPFVVEWYKTGDLTQIYYSAFAGPLGYYPSNFELFGLWTYLPFGRDYFVNLINLPVFPLLFLGLYAVSRNFKMDRKVSLLVATLFFYMPQTFRQMGVPLVDLFFSFTFVAAIYFLQEFWQSKVLKDLVLFGLASGLFIGTKYLGLPYIVPLILIAIVGIILGFWHSKKQLFIAFGSMVGSLFVGGGFWYVRNFVDVGNPIFPLELKLFGTKIFEGYLGLSERVLNTSLANSIVDWQTLQKFLNDFYLMVGVPVFLILAALIVIIIFLVISILCLSFRKIDIRKQNTLTDLSLGLLLVLGAFYYFYFYWKAPYTFQNLIPNVRYAMMFLIIGCIAVGFVASRIKYIQPLVYFVAFGAFFYNMCFLVIFAPPEILSNDRVLLDYSGILKYKTEFIFFLLSFFFVWLFFIILRNFSGKKKYFSLTFIFIIISFILFKMFVLILPERENLRDYYAKFWHGEDPKSANYILTQIAQWFDENHPEAKIAYSGFNFHYHLFGRQLQRSVDYVNINECLQCRYGDYKSSVDSIRRDPNFDNWMKNLALMQKEYLIVAPQITSNVKSYEFDWAKTHSEHFKLELERENIHVYRIIY